MMTENRHLLGRGIPAVVWICALAPGAWGDGCFVWRRGADLNEPTQKAIIHWHDGTETMVLQVKYEGPAEDFAWIVPLPARPKVSAIEAEKSPFAEISLYTQRRGRWGSRGKGLDAPGEKVEVLERKVVGVYDVAVLAAADPKALSGWLNEHGYAFPKDRTDVLGHYTKKKWVYVAMRIDRKALATDEARKLKTGELQPIRFVFESRELVYPLRISCVNAGPTEVLLYLLAAAPIVLRAGPGGDGFDGRANIPYFPHARYMDPRYGTFRKATGTELPLTWDALGLQRDSGWHLCKCRGWYAKPSEMSDDLTFAVFDPLAYWERNARKLNAHYVARHLTPLAEHDERRYGPLLREALGRMLVSGNVYNWCGVARNPFAPLELLERLADHKEPGVQGCVARNPRTPPSALRRLAASDSPDVRRAVAGNAGIPRDVLAKLLDDADEGVVSTVLQHPGFRAEELPAKLKTGSAVLRRCVAACEKTDPAILAGLARDKDASVRRSAGVNPSTPPEVLAFLARDAIAWVRVCVAMNPAAPAKLLAALAEDRNMKVQEFAARNARTPASALSRLARSDSVNVRRNVAANPSTPDEVLRKLARDEDGGVRGFATRSLTKRKRPVGPASTGG